MRSVKQPRRSGRPSRQHGKKKKKEIVWGKSNERRRNDDRENERRRKQQRRGKRSSDGADDVTVVTWRREGGRVVGRGRCNACVLFCICWTSLSHTSLLCKPLWERKREPLESQVWREWGTCPNSWCCWLEHLAERGETLGFFFPPWIAAISFRSLLDEATMSNISPPYWNLVAASCLWESTTSSQSWRADSKKRLGATKTQPAHSARK